MNKKYLFGLYKRAIIIFVFLIPVFVIMYDALGENTSNFTKISLSVLVAGIVIGVVELIRYKRTKK